MKTSIYLLTALFIPTASHSYTYNLYATSLNITVTSDSGVSTLLNRTYPYETTVDSGKIQLPNQDIKTGDTVVASASTPQTNFNRLPIVGGDQQVRFEMPGATNTSRQYYRWKLYSGEKLQGPGPNILWSGDATYALPYARLSCTVPDSLPEYSGDYELIPSFDTAVRFTSRSTGKSLLLNISCYATYYGTADVNIQLQDETIYISGPAGTPQTKESAVVVEADPGRVRLSFENNKMNELLVTFDKNNTTTMTDLTFTATSAKKVPFYVTPVNTSAGVRSYAVSVNATFI